MIRIERKLDKMETCIMHMSEKVIQMHSSVMDVLLKPDKTKELDIIQADDRINRLEEEINDMAVESLALLSPVASDLRKVIAAIKITSELERIGDYAKHIAIYLIKHESLDEKVRGAAHQMEQNLIIMLEEAMQAYMDHDSEKAFQIPQRDALIDEQYQELKQLVKNSDDLVNLVFGISSMLRNIERAGDHVKNICEHIIYMIKGQHYDFG